MSGSTGSTRAERARMPLARSVLRQVAEEHGVCVRPVAVRRTDIVTGHTEIVDIPCGATRASLCPSCAERKRRLRAAQCREGWHLTEEPALEPDPATDAQQYLTELRADLTKVHAQASGPEADELTSLLAEIDTELADSGVRGSLVPASAARRVRSTRRRQDTPRYLLRGPETGLLASGSGMTVAPCRSHDLGGGVTGPGAPCDR